MQAFGGRARYLVMETGRNYRVSYGFAFFRGRKKKISLSTITFTLLPHPF